MNSNPITLFQEYLEGHRHRMTGAVLRIAVTVFALPRSNFFTADQLANALGSTSRPTVYRTLSLLLDAGLIHCESSRHGTTKLYSHSFSTTSSDWATSAVFATKYAELCQASHRSLIAGQCPWCGQTIIDGQPSYDPA